MSRSISQCFWRVIIGQWLLFHSLQACHYVDAQQETADLYLPTNPPGLPPPQEDVVPCLPRDISGCPYDPQTSHLLLADTEFLVRPMGRFASNIGRHVIPGDQSNGHDEFLAIKVLTLMDGSERILTAGYGVNGTRKAEPNAAGTGEDFLLARFYPFGFPDPAFGSEGRVVMDFFRNNDRVWDILPLNDGTGRFLVAGSAHDAARTGAESTGKDMVIMGFFEDGEVDTGFGTAGRVTRDFRQGDDEIHALALIEHNGNPLILAVGYGTGVVNINTDRDGVLMGLTLTGEPAPGCSGDGVQPLDGSARDDEFRSLAVVPLSGNNQRIIVGGYVTQGDDNRDFLLVGFSPDCEVDSGFGNGGTVQWGSSDIDTVWAVRTTGHNNNAQLLVAGISKLYKEYYDARLELYSYRPDGTLDSSFGSDGKAEAIVRYPQDTPVTLEVIYDNDNRPNIMVGKYATMDCRRDINALLSYHLNGTRTEFEMGFNQFGEGEAAIRAIVNITGSDGRRQLVLAGHGFGAAGAGCGCSTQRDAILAGFLATGEPDHCFSADEQYLRGREECASLLPEMFPTGEPATPMATPTATPAETVTVTVTVTPTPATMTAVNTVDEGQSPECAVQVAALSSVMGVCLLGNVVLGITTGLFCALHVSGSSKLKFSFRK